MDIEDRGVIEPSVFAWPDCRAADASRAWCTGQVAAVGEMTGVMGDQVLDGVKAIHKGLAVIKARIESPRMKPAFKFPGGSGAELWGMLKHFDGQRVLPRQELSNGDASDASANDNHIVVADSGSLGGGHEPAVLSIQPPQVRFTRGI